MVSTGEKKGYSEDMIKILFICHGNICRSSCAEYVFKDMVKKAALSDRFYIESKATSSEELGNGMYPPMARVLANHGNSSSGHRARRMQREDYDDFDLIIGMDQENMYYMRRMWPEDPEDKLRLLLTYTDHPREVSDPWYTRDFETAYRDIEEGCAALLEYLLRSLQ